ncbi:DUF397 domain-containing protein [Nocardiopsis sp. LOL_012]|uniref:DUF397 domain-containing protein n=1 Tax=Nocardiopsis sp. LOL_012 TaxID=3345409 RepID=UPI003A88D89C
MRSNDRASAVWRKSSYSNGERNCVEVCDLADGQHLMRDSKHPEAGVLGFDVSEWSAFVRDVRGE